jgi:hypothetical protein
MCVILNKSIHVILLITLTMDGGQTWVQCIIKIPSSSEPVVNQPPDEKQSVLKDLLYALRGGLSSQVPLYLHYRERMPNILPNLSPFGSILTWLQNLHLKTIQRNKDRSPPDPIQIFYYCARGWGVAHLPLNPHTESSLQMKKSIILPMLQHLPSGRPALGFNYCTDKSRI